MSVLVVASTDGVQIDCPSQLLADEFGSLGTIQALFVYGNSTWCCGV